MDTGSVVSHLACRECGHEFSVDGTAAPCAECGGIIDPQYDLSDLTLDRSTVATRADTMWRYRELLPIRSKDAIVSMDEGGTPLVSCPTMADRLGVEELFLKDEGRNPTNTFKDRGQSAAMSAALEQGAETVALSSAGNAGHSASAYAARAGLDCHVYLPRQAGNVKQHMVRVHGAELHLVDGKIDDAGAAHAEAVAGTDWHSVATFQTPFRHEGKKTMGYEIFEALEWATPTEIIYPTGGGVGLIGIWKAYQELSSLGWIEGTAPRLTVAQSTGCAPIVRAIDNGDAVHEPWPNPESLARGVEIPDPGASDWILEAVYETDGSGVAVTDDAAINVALDIARSDGVEMCLTSAIAMAGAIRRAENGAFDAGDTVVVINTGAGCKTSELLGQAAASG
ncbi:MAG: threonine synthase [Salinirussus sp.]